MRLLWHADVHGLFDPEVDYELRPGPRLRAEPIVVRGSDLADGYVDVAVP